jgi:hypothetical protein
MSYPAAISAINSAPIAPSEKLTALALLDIINPTTGQTAVTWEEIPVDVSRKTLRNRLSALAAAGIITYHTGHIVYISFPSWGDIFPPRREDIPPQTGTQSFDHSPPDGNDYPESPPDGIISPPDGKKIPPRREKDHHVCLYDHTHTPERESNKQTAPGPEEQKANQALLDDINIKGWNRDSIAKRYTFPELMAHVMAYRAEKSLGKVRGPGAFVSRTLNRYGVDPITGAAPVDELYDKHVTPHALATYAAGMPTPGSTVWDTLAQDNPAPEQKEPESVTAPRPINPSQFSILNSNFPPHPDGQAVWTQALAIIQPSFTPAKFAHFQAATVTDYQNGNGVHLTLTAPPESLDFLQSQGRALIRRALGQVKRTGQVNLYFVGK